MAEITGDRVGTKPPSYVEWAPIFAGAVGAAAISFLLLSFGSAIGLTAISPWPNAGLPIAVAGILAALWLLIVQVGSFAAGGYLAGRLRAPVGERITPERHFRDGAHGFLVWGLGILLGMLALAIASGGALSIGADVASNVAGGATQAVVNQASGTPAEVATDLLLRPDPTVAAPTSGPGELADTRAELGRLLSGSLEAGSLSPADTSYLAGVVARRTGIPEADAQKRVDDAFAAAQQAANKAREAADTARRAAAVAGFAAAASLLISLVAATAAAGLGGRHRDEGRANSLFGAERFW